MTDLIRDLTEEYESLDAFVTPLGEKAWDMATPFASWTIRDEICHLAFFDSEARLSATNSVHFDRHKNELLLKYKDPFEETLNIGRAMSTEKLLAWWRQERHDLIESLISLHPKDRLCWFGPPMSVQSFITARLMETWAHGQDIMDALGQIRPVTDRLRHIAHLGVGTCVWSFMLRQMPPPTASIRVELISPSGACWIWGPAEADEIIHGEAEDFCFVVTQRRHVDDTNLKMVGGVARQWMLIAQAFAGPPATGPDPGRFSGR